MKATGGKTVYGASVGILMLEAQFPRIPGDLGNALTWDFPVHYRVVRQASPDLVVRRGAEGMLPAFIEAGEELVRMGVDGITTNCGFLSLFQAELSAALKVPVASSSLMQVAMVNTLLPPRKVCGILTISGGKPDGPPPRRCQCASGDADRNHGRPERIHACHSWRRTRDGRGRRGARQRRCRNEAGR